MKPSQQISFPPPPEKSSMQDVGDIEAIKKISVMTDTVRVKVERLDRIMNLVAELVLNKSIMQQMVSTYNLTDLYSIVNQFDKTISQLQEEVLITRMVPLKNIFDRYPRTVRDLSKRLKKEIELEIIGSEIEVDRTLLDEINEPLLHLLRNAIDHGIETPQQRLSLGKPAVGKIKLIAKREKGYCIIEVSDDGRGMDPEEIKRKAVEREIITTEEAKMLSEQEAFMLICDPNFSTAEKVTEVSGRGVGMDVVRNIVNKYNGRLEIISKKNRGTSFILYLPLTLAIIQALLVKVNGQIYALPLSNVIEITKIQESNLKTIEDKGRVLILREEVIPLLWLKDILKIEEGNLDTNEEKENYAIIVELHERKFGVVVPALLGQQQIVIKSLGGILKGTKLFSGSTILGDGSVILIIDIGGLTS